MDLSTNEENYLKAIYFLSEQTQKSVSTNTIAEHLEIKPASITDMIKRLAQKKLVLHEKYKGVSLTEKGQHIALRIIRKHRLWETFLVQKLNFGWDQVHDIAEQLEHIKSPDLVNKLDDFLGNPLYDPHGDPIPNKDGEFAKKQTTLLSDLPINQPSKVIGVNDSSDVFLKYLNELSISLGTPIEIIESIDFDKSLQIKLDNQSTIMISSSVAENIYVE